MHMQHLGSLNSCRETHSCTPYQTSTAVALSHLLVTNTWKEEGIRLFPESKPKKKEAVSLIPISGIQV